MGEIINFSGWYTVEFLTKEQNSLVMKLTVLGRDEYEIKLTPNDLKIKIIKNSLNPFMGKYGPEDLRWIPKYMLRPNKWGKRIFKINPQLITKLWGLVADKKRMKALKGIPYPWNVTIKL